MLGGSSSLHGKRILNLIYSFRQRVLRHFLWSYRWSVRSFLSLLVRLESVFCRLSLGSLQLFFLFAHVAVQLRTVYALVHIILNQRLRLYFTLDYFRQRWHWFVIVVNEDDVVSCSQFFLPALFHGWKMFLIDQRVSLLWLQVLPRRVLSVVVRRISDRLHVKLRIVVMMVHSLTLILTSSAWARLIRRLQWFSASLLVILMRVCPLCESFLSGVELVAWVICPVLSDSIQLLTHLRLTTLHKLLVLWA